MKKKYSFLFVLYKSQSKSTSPSTDFRQPEKPTQEVLLLEKVKRRKVSPIDN